MVAYAWEYEDPAHPRPPEVARVEAFLNTVDEHRFGAHRDKPAGGRDLLSDAEALRGWLDGHDLGQFAAGLTETDVERARAVRRTLREWLRRRQGLPHDVAAVASGTALADASGGFVLADRARLVPRSTGVKGAIEALLGDLVVAEATGNLRRLKMCSAEDCRFVFYDRSRSRTSRWCSMQTCGNRHKTRRYRQRGR